MDSLYSTLITVISTICGLLFFYQVIYMFVALIKKVRTPEAASLCTYGILIAARNEEAVIGNLIKSIQAQDYPADLYRIFVVADNCTDGTAQAAREAGATVYERFDETEKGKGYALRYLFGEIKRDFGLDSFDGYMVFDADNLLAQNYLTEMNKMFSNGWRICTSYRNTKNYGANWVTAANGIWFLREARHLNHARMVLGVSCTVSGTGYVMHRDIVKRNNGWNFFLLTEDYDFSMDSILKDEKIGYCESAIFYDEQPTSFAASFTQRLRWAKGFYQVLYKYFRGIVRRLFTKGDFACYDALITLSPGHIFLFAVAVIGFLFALKSGFDPWIMTGEVLELVLPMLLSSYVSFFGMALLILLTEHKKIYCKTSRAVLLAFLFPLFIYTYIPISIIALFAKVKWKPVQHTFALDNDALQQQSKPEKKP